MTNNWKQSAAALAVAFTTATPTWAQDAADPAAPPVMTPERLEVVNICMDKIEKMIDARDTRTPGTSITQYYFNNETNATAIRTALKTGNYEGEKDALEAWSQLQTMAAFSLVMNRYLHCGVLADENGDINMDMYEEWTDILVRSSNKVYDILTHLKDEGDKLIAAGTPRVKPNEFVPLFR